MFLVEVEFKKLSLRLNETNKLLNFQKESLFQ